MSDVVSGFTFHNVSINSLNQLTKKTNTSSFTFHNVSINSRLKTVGHMKLNLLIHGVTRLEANSTAFTFHNVSINSGYLLYESKPYPHNLHSIMYLLIRRQEKRNEYI